MPMLKPGTIFPTDEEDAAITAAAASDPDCPILTDEEWARVKPLGRIGALPVSRPQGPVEQPTLSMHVDADVLSAFRQSGKDWQARINAVLREAAEAGRV